MSKKRLSRSLGGNIGVFLVLAIIGVFMIMPIILSINNAFKPLDEILIFPPKFFVRKPTIDNFVQLGQITADFWVPLSRYAFNSIFVSAVSTFGHLFIASMAAYPLAKHNFPGKNLINTVVQWSLLFTPAVLTIPLYIVMAKLHMINTYWSLILPVIAGTTGVYLMVQFMGQMENAVLEAARIDGCNEYGIYWHIVMPNMKPAWITAMIFAFQNIWNNNGGLYIYKENLKVLPAILGQILSGGTARTGVSAAATLVMIIPPLLLFYLSQNFVLETMSTSGMK